MIAHPCPICRRVTSGTLTDDGLRFACCPDCLDKTLPELEAVERRTRAWICRVCGCTHERACPGGCSWAEPNLCSRCAENSAIYGPGLPAEAARHGATKVG